MLNEHLLCHVNPYNKQFILAREPFFRPLHTLESRKKAWSMRGSIEEWLKRTMIEFCVGWVAIESTGMFECWWNSQVAICWINSNTKHICHNSNRHTKLIANQLDKPQHSAATFSSSTEILKCLNIVDFSRFNHEDSTNSHALASHSTSAILPPSASAALFFRSTLGLSTRRGRKERSHNKHVHPENELFISLRHLLLLIQLFYGTLKRFSAPPPRPIPPHTHHREFINVEINMKAK